MTTGSASGGRIVIDTEEVRNVAARLRGGALLLSSAGRELAARPLPSAPPTVAAAVSEVICRANAELQDLATELIAEATTLSARATWAALGGGEEIAWLIPGLRSYPTAQPMPENPSEALAPVTDEQIRASSEWAVEILDGMHDSMREVNEEIDKLGPKADEVFGREVVAFVDGYADELPVKALGRFTLAAGVALDVVEHWDRGWKEAGARAGMSAAGGALGTGLCMLLAAPTGPGILGCVLVGGAAGSVGGGYVGDRVFDE